MELPSLASIESASKRVYAHFNPTPQYCWPQLCERSGAEVWVKHENYTPVGAFKVRGGVIYMERLKSLAPSLEGIITATRGNHGQSVAYAAKSVGLKTVVCVPHGNSIEKNRGMRLLGAELIEHGHDFQEAREHGERLASERGLHWMPSFHEDLIQGVSSYALELFRSTPNIDSVYVPIGLGSGICATVAVREALGLSTKIVGVVAKAADAYKRSFEKGETVETDSANTIADGMACRVPESGAVEIINRHVDRIVSLDEHEITDAMRAYFVDTHNVAEPAGAAPLAALLQERDRMQGKRVGLILTGANVDSSVFGPALLGME